MTESDHARTAAVMMRPPRVKLSSSTFVNEHGPAMQVRRASWNALPSPASKDAFPILAFHFPSGEQTPPPLQGTFPILVTSKLFPALPTVSVVVAASAYRTRTLLTVSSGCSGAGPSARGIGVMRIT